MLDRLRPGQIVCAGRGKPGGSGTGCRPGVTLHDYFAREELAVANAVPTAGGSHSDRAGGAALSRCTGPGGWSSATGRLGRALAPRLAALGAKVSVAARRWADLAWIEAAGYGVEHSEELCGWLCGYDLIVNTAPARLLDEAALRDLKPGCMRDPPRLKARGAGVGKG